MLDAPITRLIAAGLQYHASRRRQLGMSANEYLLLAHLVTSKDPMPVGELGRLINVTSGGMSAIVERLVTAQYIDRVPDEADRETVHRIIYDELCLGVIREESREAYRQIMARLVERGAQAIILGCTEIMLLVGEGDASVPLFDTTRIHAETAAALALD